MRPLRIIMLVPSKPAAADPVSLRPLAVELYEQHRQGRSAEQIASSLGIPLARVEQRLRAAAAYLQRNRQMPDQAA